jgi:glycosyltransferase involved in cell wall biosynthesis
MKQFFYNASLHGVLKPFAKPVYNGLITMELFIEHLLDQPSTADSDQDLIDSSLTAVIKTFERPKTLRRLVISIRAMYPHMKVIVVDDSQDPVKLDGVETIFMPYDSGVSAGRSEGLKHVKTKYLMLLDDDFVFNRYTQIQPVVEKLEAYPEIDIIGGDVINLPFYQKIDIDRVKDRIHPTKAISVAHPGTQIAGMTVYDKVANFFIARTESIKKVDWDPQIKRLDHADFFTRCKGVLTTAFDPKFKVLHAKTLFDKDYMDKRFDLESDRKFLRDKYYRKR